MSERSAIVDPVGWSIVNAMTRCMWPIFDEAVGSIDETICTRCCDTDMFETIYRCMAMTSRPGEKLSPIAEPGVVVYVVGG